MPGIRLPVRDTSFERPAMAETGLADYYGTLVYDTLYHSPVGSFGALGGPQGGVQRWSELNVEESYNTSPKLSPQEATAKYGMDGLLKFDEPVNESVAQIIEARKKAELRRSYLLEAGSQDSWTRKISGFGVSMAASLIDPVNLGSMFIPVVGESRLLTGVERASGFLTRGFTTEKQLLKMFGGSVAKMRIAKGAIEGLTGMALVEPLNLVPSIQEQSDYGVDDSLVNLGVGTFLGGTLHFAGGLIRDKFFNVRRVMSKADPQTHEAATITAVNDLVQDQPVTSPAEIVSMDHNLVQEEMKLKRQLVNSENMFAIAQEWSDRFEQLVSQGHELTTAQAMKLQFVRAILKNRNEYSSRNLANLFDMDIDEARMSMPDAFRHVDNATMKRMKAEIESKVREEFGPFNPSEERPPIPFSEDGFSKLSSKMDELENDFAKRLIDPESKAGKDFAAGKEDVGSIFDMMGVSSIVHNIKSSSSFKSVYKRILSLGFNPEESRLSMGGESMVLIFKDKVVKISDKDVFEHSIPGLTARVFNRFTDGNLHVEVSERVKPLSEIGDVNMSSVEQAFEVLGNELGYRMTSDASSSNIGITSSGDLVFLDKGHIEPFSAYSAEFYRKSAEGNVYDKETQGRINKLRKQHRQATRSLDELHDTVQNEIDRRYQDLLRRKLAQDRSPASEPVESPAPELKKEAEPEVKADQKSIKEDTSKVQEQVTPLQKEMDASTEAHVLDKAIEAIDTAIRDLDQDGTHLYSDPLLIQTLGKPLYKGLLIAVREGLKLTRDLDKAIKYGIEWLENEQAKSSPFGKIDLAPDSTPKELHSSNLEQKNPLNLRVAAKSPDGSVHVGKAGDHHFNLPELPEGSDFGFVSPDGKYLSREEAANLSQSAKREKSSLHKQIEKVIKLAAKDYSLTPGITEIPLPESKGYMLKLKQMGSSHPAFEGSTYIIFGYQDKQGRHAGTLMLTKETVDDPYWELTLHEIGDLHRGQGLGRQAVPELGPYVGNIRSSPEPSVHARKMWEALTENRSTDPRYADYRVESEVGDIVKGMQDGITCLLGKIL